MTVPRANIFTAKVERSTFNKNALKPLVWNRFMASRRLGTKAHDVFKPDGNRKSAVSLFYFCSHCHIYIVKQLSLAQANFCSRLLQLSEFPWCNDSPQIENKFFSDDRGPKPDLYKRYIDDCAGVTSSSREELLFITSVSFFSLSSKIHLANIRKFIIFPRL